MQSEVSESGAHVERGQNRTVSPHCFDRSALRHRFRSIFRARKDGDGAADALLSVADELGSRRSAQVRVEDERRGLLFERAQLGQAHCIPCWNASAGWKWACAEGQRTCQLRVVVENGSDADEDRVVELSQPVQGRDRAYESEVQVSKAG